MLIHLVDVSPESSIEPLEAYDIIRRELEDYSNTLKEKQEIIVANKIDAKGSRPILSLFKRELAKPIIAISCISGDGIKKLKKELVCQL
jgi:GTP-binding protein